MGIVRLVPARRVAEVLGFIGAVLSITCSQSGNIINMLSSNGQDLTAQQLPLSALSRFNAPWSPLAWAGRGLVDIGEGRWLSGGGFLILTVGLAAVLFLISLNTAERLYYSGWAGMQVNARKKKPVRNAAAASVRQSPIAAAFERFVPAPIRAILTKDFRLLRRDLRNMSQLVTPLIFGVIYGFFLLRSGGVPARVQGDVPAWIMVVLKDVMIYVNVGISLFVSWSLISRLALMSFSMEGKYYWMLKSAPVRAGSMIAAKYLVAYLPALSVGWIYYSIISLLQPIAASTLVFGFLVVAFAIAGSAGINLSMGITGANLKWEDPRRMNSGTTGCVSMLISFGYMMVCLSLFFAPPVVFSLFGLPGWVGQLIGLCLGGAVSLVCAILPLRLVSRRVSLIGEA
jgi:ABC-2 type transport system permease protein